MTTIFTTRRAAMALILTGTLALGACTQVTELLPSDQPRTTVALIDRSGSIVAEDNQIYAASLNAIATNLQGGDRVVFAPVAERSKWRPAIDLTITRSSVRLDQEETIAAASDELATAASALLQDPASSSVDTSKTHLIESIAAASQVFGAPPYVSAQLIILSDGEECSEVVNLENATITPQLIESVLDRAEQQGLIPNLTGLTVTFAGAGGKDFDGNYQFWKGWATRTGASLIYGRLPYDGRR